MTQNFKPGDRVRVAPHITVKHLTIICIDMIENQQSILNGVGTVTSDNVEWARVDYGGRKWNLPVDYLILVQPQPEAQKPAEPAFKAGDRVRVRLDVKQEQLTALYCRPMSVPVSLASFGLHTRGTLTSASTAGTARGPSTPPCWSWPLRRRLIRLNLSLPRTSRCRITPRPPTPEAGRLPATRSRCLCPR